MRDIITVDDIRVPIGTHEDKTIFIGSDHRGFEYKKEILAKFKERGYDVIDVGTCSSERCDYPPISDKIGKGVSEDPYNCVGIGICGSGIGILISASKHKGVYIARCLNPEEAKTSRKHNNTNVLGIGADYINLETTLATVDAWLITPFYTDPSNDKAYLDRYVQTVKLEAAAGQLNLTSNLFNP